MPKISGANIAIFIFLVIVLALVVAAIIGKLTGGWEVQPVRMMVPLEGPGAA